MTEGLRSDGSPSQHSEAGREDAPPKNNADYALVHLERARKALTDVSNGWALRTCREILRELDCARAFVGGEAVHGQPGNPNDMNP